MPQWWSRTRLISVEGIDAVMCCRYKDYVVRISIDGQVRHVEGLCKHIAIDRVRDTFPKLRYSDITRIQKSLIGVLTCAQGVTFISQDSLVSVNLRGAARCMCWLLMA